MRSGYLVIWYRSLKFNLYICSRVMAITACNHVHSSYLLPCHIYQRPVFISILISVSTLRKKYKFFLGWILEINMHLNSPGFFMFGTPVEK